MLKWAAQDDRVRPSGTHVLYSKWVGISWEPEATLDNFKPVDLRLVKHHGTKTS